MFCAFGVLLGPLEISSGLVLEVVVDFLTQFLETLAARAVRECTFHTEELV